MQRIIASLAVILAMAAALIVPATPGRAFEQGTITVTKTWVTGQEPVEVVEVCFVVTADADGIEVLGEACTSDDTYTVAFGPTAPDLQTGITYYVWEKVGAGWSVTGDNPVAVVIPDTTGEAEVTIENAKASGEATITIHKAICPDGTGDLFGECHDNRVAGVRFAVKGNRIVTDEEGIATTTVAAGKVRITEAAIDFANHATAGAAYVYCSVEPGTTAVLFDGRADHRTVTIDVPDGATVICDWYDLTVETVQPATLELHKRVCPLGAPVEDIFDECHGNPPEQPVSFSLDDMEPQFVDDDGDLIFSDVTLGTHAVAETEGPPLAYVTLRVFCSVSGVEAEATEIETDGPNFEVTVGEGEHVICDVYNIPEDLSGRTPTPTSTATEPLPTKTPIGPTSTPTKTPTPTATSTPVVGRPIHIHAGTCKELAEEPRYNLTDLTTPVTPFKGAEAAAIVETSYTVVNVSLDDLLASEYAINVHGSREEMSSFVACGEIGGSRRADGSIVIGLQEQSSSGLTGIVYLVPDPTNANRTRVSVFLAAGLAEEDPTLQPPAGGGTVIHSIVNNGPVSPEYQAGYEITIDANGHAVIVVTPPGAAADLGEDTTADIETREIDLSEEELTAMLTELKSIGFFGLTQVSEIDPNFITVGGSTSILTVNLVDGTWDVDGNGLPGNEANVLTEAQRIVADAVGGVEVPEAQ